ncbi:cobalamin (vitamin B12) biosynthesis CbiX protein [Desulforamulus reducens MI-1]|uniref:Cobalamin (Vitamin B12) biosynthesis CbiX protein n=1 Tax=Desulforamulus reducens (strain ATCC BAA-1160 / DSM 100696 / MI-1) TaxID=349161 RepID=A4J808_DESRM|nr:CbiX/SirB N-terminal domain-containing protein [Desulforamulus reducens]ABO51211.1 cobalamin (vitamin B12) biosynthesis CbiX protein [Desulforamulus reducens MI-1]
MQEGVIVLAHGSRYPKANQEIFQITEQVKIIGGITSVETCFLQFGQPTLPQVVEEMNRTGIKAVTVVPLLLAVGSHIQEDLPELLKEQKKRYPHMTFRLAPHLGADRRIAEIVIDRMKQGSEIKHEF